MIREFRTRLVLLLATLLPAALVAQEAERHPVPEHYRFGKVRVDGEWQAPTPAVALRMLAGPQVDGDPAAVVLRQVYASYSAGELRVIEDQLVDLIITGTDEQRAAARLALAVAADIAHGDPGVPYAGGRDAFIRVFEALRDETYERARDYLSDIVWLNGLDYIREVFEASEPPPPCFQPHDARPGDPVPPESEWCPPVRKVPWCDAGGYLLHKEGGPDFMQHVRLCGRMR